MRLFLLLIGFVSADYWSDREALLAAEKSLQLGSNIQLDAKEIAVNNLLMEEKLREIDDGFLHPENYIPAKHFFDARPLIENNKIFKFLKKLPKGALLHGHDTALASLDYLFDLTYMDNLYGCISNDRLQLRFFQTPAADCNWRLVSEMREENDNFNDYLISQISITKVNPHEDFTDINKAWSLFQQTFATAEGLICYAPVFKQYFKQVLLELYEDNVMYADIRTTLSSVYDLNGTNYDYLSIAGIFKEAFQEFKLDHADFAGARIIYAPLRKVSNDTIENYIDNVINLKNTYPNLIAGFDLVGQEDLGYPLEQFITALKSLEIDVYYHAGETNWYGITDLNIIDAILLGSKRIGHGYALDKHPIALELIKEKNIALEISPISNQVLKLVEDLRNHPAVFYIANGYPVVIGSDDPTFWGATALSYDWYMAYMGFGARDSDLKLLKQLAINSLEYSSMPLYEKTVAIDAWKLKWNTFLDDIISNGL